MSLVRIHRVGLLSLFIAFACCARGGYATMPEDAPPVRLASLFTDHMVLQREQPVPVWGTARPGATVLVRCAGKEGRALTDDAGRWMVRLPALQAGGPHQLVVEAGERFVVEDVIVGDVWICAGQSNMEWPLSAMNSFDNDLKTAEQPLLRHFHVAPAVGLSPGREVDGKWQSASPATVGHWSAVGFYFGQTLQKHVKVPVGLLNLSLGGTRVEAWTSLETLRNLPGMTHELSDVEAARSEWEEKDAAYRSANLLWQQDYARLLELAKDLGHQKRLADPALNDSAWAQMDVPERWERAGLPNLDGEVWFRKTVTIPKEWENKDLELCLGPVDEIDTTFFNGVKIGGMGSLEPLVTRYWNIPRCYFVPASQVKAGKAVIAVRVVDQCGAGGLWGEGAEVMQLRLASRQTGGLPISLAGMWKYHVACTVAKRPSFPISQNMPAALFNGMVAGVVPYAIKGVIWYQGESNAPSAYIYRERFPAMIRDWRKQWQQGAFPFLWVSLANYGEPPLLPGQSSWAVVRESQEKALSLSHTGRAVAIDLGDADDIHPQKKQDVGERLALVARSVAYEESLVAQGPVYRRMQVEGNKIRLWFDHVGSGLTMRGEELNQFAIAGSDGEFVWAQAKLDGNTVLVWSDRVRTPVAVRYAWANNPEGCNLYNREGLPAHPFRTDDWQVITQPKSTY